MQGRCHTKSETSFLLQIDFASYRVSLVLHVAWLFGYFSTPQFSKVRHLTISPNTSKTKSPKKSPLPVISPLRRLRRGQHHEAVANGDIGHVHQRRQHRVVRAYLWYLPAGLGPKRWPAVRRRQHRGQRKHPVDAAGPVLAAEWPRGSAAGDCAGTARGSRGRWGRGRRRGYREAAVRVGVVSSQTNPPSKQDRKQKKTSNTANTQRGPRRFLFFFETNQIVVNRDKQYAIGKWVIIQQ